jgi:hypothetical protein
MKSLKDILLESKKTYPFKIGVAGELPEGFNERLRMALEKFTIDSLSSGKKTPIQEHPLDFPQLDNMEVTFWDAELKYPTTDHILREYLATVCSVHVSHIVVRNPNSPQTESDEKGKDETYEVLLTNANMESTSAQQFVGNNRVMDLLKELEAAKKERGEESFMSETPKKEPQNSKSTIGS